ncbi:MAG: sulfur carrier protein ThiS [Verrucomicrobiota bacterium]
MIFTLNGKETNEHQSGLSVGSLLDALGFGGKPVLVELDGVALFPREFESTEIVDGAKVEVIQIAAGG